MECTKDRVNILVLILSTVASANPDVNLLRQCT